VSPDRHRDKKGQINHKHGSVPMAILRKIYGQSFAAGLSPTTTLYEALELFGPHPISEMHLKMLQWDYDDGLLERKIKKALGHK
jgi:hypothetical protein